MDEVEKFIKCPGLLKNTIVKKYNNTFKIRKRFYAFFIDFKNENVIVLVKWSNDKTISMIQTERSILLELWRSGKRVKGRKWSREKECGLFTACMNFYDIEDYLEIESHTDKDLLSFLFS
jgi:hypothetical protein